MLSVRSPRGARRRGPSSRTENWNLETPMTDTARIAVIGTGWWSTTAHIPALQANPNADLVALGRRPRRCAGESGPAFRRGADLYRCSRDAGAGSGWTAS